MKHLLPLEQEKARSWQEYLLDSLLATAGSLLVTGMIDLWACQMLGGLPSSC